MSKLKSPTKRVAVICVAAALVIGGGGAAFAYWSSTGSGVGAATTGTSEAFVVTSEPADGALLTPGGAAQTVTFTVSNPSTASLTLTGVAVSVAGAAGATWTDGDCSAADYTLGTPDFEEGVIAGGDEVEGTVTVTMIDTGVNQDDCQGVSVPLYFVAS